MAQSDQLIRNQQVAGSNPVTSSKKEKTSKKDVFSFCKPITVCELQRAGSDSLAGDGNPFVLADISPNRGITRHQLQKRKDIQKGYLFFLQTDNGLRSA